MSSGATSREEVLAAFRKELLQHREQEAKLKRLREELAEKSKDYDKSEEDLKAVQSGVGQIIGNLPLAPILIRLCGGTNLPDLCEYCRRGVETTNRRKVYREGI